MTQEEIERLADAIHERMAKEILRLPDVFKEHALGNYILPRVTIPMHDTSHSYFILDIRITERKQMLFRLSDMMSSILKEWIME